MSRTASWLLLAAAVLGAAAMVSGLLLLDEFRGLLAEGAGAADSFTGSAGARWHGRVGHAAAAAAIPAAATGLLLGLHGLLAAEGRRVRAALIGVTSPMLLFWALGAAYTGHASWAPTLLGELQAEVFESFLRTHAVVFGGGLAALLLVQGLALAWLRRAEPGAEEDD